VARPTISAVLIARDEEANLPDCLDSLTWVDEVVVVVDANGRDATEAVARTRADRVLLRPFDHFAAQRNAGLDLASGDWVLSIDADERATPGLAAEVRSTIEDASRNEIAYRVPIRSVVLGRAFLGSGTQNDRPIRLFRRDVGCWEGLVHEVVRPSGAVGEVSAHLTHETIPNMRVFLHKLDRYTTLEAEQFAREGRPWRLTDLLLRPPWTFAKLYLARQGFRDGLEGLMFCALSAVSVAVRHWKHREIVRGAT
jgi:glycosyltransferase involved in cell wall biosynthesis